MPLPSDPPPRKRRQSLYQPSGKPPNVPYPEPSPSPMILHSQARIHPSYPMYSPLPEAGSNLTYPLQTHARVHQSHPTYSSPPETQPHPPCPLQPWNNPGLTDLPPRLQSQTIRTGARARSRSQPPAERMPPQSQAPPPVPSIPSRLTVTPTHVFATNVQPAPSTAEDQPGVTNWCTKLMNFSKSLGMNMTYDEFEAGTRSGKVWVVKYFLNGIEYGECFSSHKSKNKIKQGAACQAYMALSREQEEKKVRYQSSAHY
ncbi:hypothetical protein DL96DRAFT_1550877 [Flagelloscypha sp. PMI_526]|nr:hypothetical protein DL96DRAFT_1550877 [Flagelloscypha sp. PMI_526]